MISRCLTPSTPARQHPPPWWTSLAGCLSNYLSWWAACFWAAGWWAHPSSGVNSLWRWCPWASHGSACSCSDMPSMPPPPAQLGIGVQWIDHAARAGFPSMHAAGAFALAASLAAGTRRTLPWLAGSACAMAVAIAWSRVCLGVHFPSDVLAGALTGVLCACGVHAMEQQAQRINWRRRFSAYWSRRALPWARHR